VFDLAELEAAQRERDRLLGWRRERFFEMGADFALAERLAESPVDLHDFEDLRGRGCSVETAAEILL
jgi:hypothetical protein